MNTHETESKREMLKAGSTDKNSRTESVRLGVKPLAVVPFGEPLYEPWGILLASPPTVNFRKGGVVRQFEK